MTRNKRIFVNIVATYGRSLFTLVCGLFTARWVLMALGQEDFGLYGVIGGLVVFIGFANNLLGSSLGRFYAVSVGKASAAEDAEVALEECRAWFSSAVFVHTAVPLLLMALGWPLGECAIQEGWISVPATRLQDCLWVLRYSCIAAFVGMISVPFNAMYTAKQYIAELTIYSFATTSLNMAFFYYMVTHPGVWLAKYALWMAFVSVAPQTIIAIRACWIFPECKLRVRQMVSFCRMRQLFSYAGWQAFGVSGAILRNQGIAILLNRFVQFGPMRNSSMTVANQLAVQTDTLAGAMVAAFQPAIANAYGAGDFDRMRNLAFCTCKMGTLLSLIFVLPLSLELPEVLRLWLKEPPVYAAGFCWAILAAHIVDRTAIGHQLAVNASGRIAVYQACLGSFLILTLPLAWFFLLFGLSVYSVGWALLIGGVLCAWGRVGFARSIVGMSARLWLGKILLPLVVVCAVVLSVGCLPRLLMEASFLRVVVTTLLSELVLFSLAWQIVLQKSEREFVLAKVRILRARFANG